MKPEWYVLNNSLKTDKNKKYVLLIWTIFYVLYIIDDYTYIVNITVNLLMPSENNLQKEFPVWLKEKVSLLYIYNLQI